MKLLFAFMALVFLTASDCGGRLYVPPPEDSCFEGSFASGEFSLIMDYDTGQVWTTVIKPATSESPWEAMSFIGKITETGRAVGVLRLNFPDNDTFEEWDYSISLEPATGACSTRNTLRFSSIEYDDGARGTFGYTLTRQP